MKVLRTFNLHNLKFASLEWECQDSPTDPHPLRTIAPITQGQIQAMMLQLLSKGFFDSPELHELQERVNQAINHQLAFKNAEPQAGFTYTLNGELYHVISVGVWNPSPKSFDIRHHTLEKVVTYTDSNGYSQTSTLTSFKQEMTRVS